GVLTATEIDNLTAGSALVKKYQNSIDKENAYEILSKRMVPATEESQASQEAPKTTVTKEQEEPSLFDTILKNPMAKTFGTTLMREGAKAILGMLGLKSTYRRRRY
ncbi:helicase HerA-like domain-containing protein, partial [Riemerella anatipestifer]